MRTRRQELAHHAALSGVVGDVRKAAVQHAPIPRALPLHPTPHPSIPRLTPAIYALPCSPRLTPAAIHASPLQSTPPHQVTKEGVAAAEPLIAKAQDWFNQAMASGAAHDAKKAEAASTKAGEAKQQVNGAQSQKVHEQLGGRTDLNACMPANPHL